MDFVQAQQLLLRLEGHWKAAAIRIARKKGFGAAQLLEAVPLTIKEAELGILHIPRDEHVLQTYAVVRAHLRDGLAFPGLSELLEQEQPAHSESLIVGMVGELANYGTLGNLLRCAPTRHVHYMLRSTCLLHACCHDTYEMLNAWQSIIGGAKNDLVGEH